MNDLMNISQPI